MQFKYKKRHHYKYTLSEQYIFETQWINKLEVNTQFIQLNAQGQLLIQKAYAWDGASGPMPDLPSIMRASLIHDALYQLIRERHIASSYRNAADRLLLEICLADGMNPILSRCVYFCVRCFGHRYVRNNQLTLSPHH